MASSREQCAVIVAHLSVCAPVTARAMFGGYGLYRNGVMFALIADDTLYFKVDEENIGDYEAAGTAPFVYDGKGKPIAMSYYQLPDAIWDDFAALHVWLDKAYAAGRRAQAKRRKPRSRQ